MVAVRFQIQKFYVLPTKCISVFLYRSKNAGIICPYNINRWVLTTETVCVYRAVRTESKIQVNFHLCRLKRHTERDKVTNEQ